MTLFGLDEKVVAPLVRVVAGDGLSTEQIEDRFARASWTGIAEPGDRMAGELVAALGASGALASLVEGLASEAICESVVARGGDVSLDDIEAAVARWRPRMTSAAAVTALQQAARFSVRLLVPADLPWPVALDDLGPHAPLALWIRGNESAITALDRSIALVGARAATGYGEHVTMEASAGLVDRGYAIVSGAAYGIDGMAHRAALASSGQTVAFLAGGVDRFYPSGHDELLTRIVAAGAVVSELPCGSAPTRWRFLQRNRLIAAASGATIVLEAGRRSGSLNTAGHAATLGRPLGAVPGPVTSAASAGCHRLIQEFDAVCVTNADEMAALHPLGVAAEPESVPSPSSTQVRVLDALSTRAPRATADIAARSGLSVSDAQSTLGLLELDGAVVERERGWIRRTERTPRP